MDAPRNEEREADQKITWQRTIEAEPSCMQRGWGHNTKAGRGPREVEKICCCPAKTPLGVLRGEWRSPTKNMDGCRIYVFRNVHIQSSVCVIAVFPKVGDSAPPSSRGRWERTRWGSERKRIRMEEEKGAVGREVGALREKGKKQQRGGGSNTSFLSTFQPDTCVPS